MKRPISKRHPKTQPYLHGYTKKEQQRLYHQAEFMRPYVYPGVELNQVSRMLEVGVGVGAQSSILLELNPRMHLTGLDISEVQLAAARTHLATPLREGRVELYQRNAEDLSGLPGNYDGAFMCWFLEHVPSPPKVLKQVYQVLKPGSIVYCTEILNSTLFVHPYSPAILQYWFEFNDYQWEIKGHPFIGAQLGNLLLNAGFRDIDVESRSILCDSREPQLRKEMIASFRDIFLSAYPGLVKNKRVTPKLVANMKREFTALMRAKDSVFYFTFMRATARK